MNSTVPGTSYGGSLMRTNLYVGDEWILEKDKTQRLLDSSRELRIAAADHIDSLMTELKDAVTKKIEGLRKRSDTKKGNTKS